LILFQVMQITFYDVVLDFILMDAFEDLAHPPASVLAVAQNRFLSASFKESVSAILFCMIASCYAVVQSCSIHLRLVFTYDI
jgi:hypothetical protein